MAVGGTGSQGTTHPAKILANIFIAFIGAGVLGLPFAFKEAGILEGMIVMATIGFISVKAMLLLIDCKYKLISEYRLPRNEKAKVECSPKKTVDDNEAVEDGLLSTSIQTAKQEFVNLLTEEINKEEDPGHDLSYGDVGFYAIGYHGRLLVDIAIVLSQTGFCCAYLIFITENLTDYINSIKLLHWLIILLPPLCFMTLLRHLGSLALTSFMAQCSNLLAFAVVLWFDFDHFNHVDKYRKMRAKQQYVCKEMNQYMINTNWKWILSFGIEWTYRVMFEYEVSVTFVIFKLCTLLLCTKLIIYRIHPKKMSIVGLPFFICIAIYCYEGAGMILSLESSLAKEVRKSFKKYFKITMVIVTCLYISFGSAGYMSFGPETNAIITLNLPKGESLDFALVVKSLLCLALFFTYPVMMFPVMKILEGYLIKTPEKNIWRGNFLRIIMVIITGTIVMLIPSFANLMALVGATCCTMLAFVLPGLFHMSIFKGSLTIYQVIVDWSLIFIGIVGAIMGTIDAFKRLNSIPHQEIQRGNMTHAVETIVNNIIGNVTHN